MLSGDPRPYTVEWSNRVPSTWIIVVTNRFGTRYVHSSTNRRYLEKLVETRYSK